MAKAVQGGGGRTVKGVARLKSADASARVIPEINKRVAADVANMGHPTKRMEKVSKSANRAADKAGRVKAYTGK